MIGKLTLACQASHVGRVYRHALLLVSRRAAVSAMAGDRPQYRSAPSCLRALIVGIVWAALISWQGPNGRNDHTHRHMFLRATPRCCRGRAGSCISLSLSRLSEAHRERLWRAGSLAPGSSQDARRYPHLAPHRRRWHRARLPLLPTLRLDSLVYAGRGTRIHRGRRRCFRRPQLSGAGPLKL